MLARRWQALLIGVAAAATAVQACGGNGTTGTGGGGSGGATSSSSSHASSTTGVTTGTGGATGANLANNCTSDTDCGDGLICIKDTDTNVVFGGGPAGGYCSAKCDTDDDCPGGAVCVHSDPKMPGLCTATCTIGPELMYLNDPFDPNKCWGRNDVRCTPVSNTVTACLPTCGEDSQCPQGRVCDPRLAVCVDTPTMGKPAGAKCDPNASAPECAGICVNFTGGETSCSSPCVLGGQSDPTDTPNCGGVTKGLCVYSPAGNGAGDYGFCAPACTTQDDCQAPSFWCRPVGGLTGSGVDNGYCLGAPGCPNGAGDCTQTGTMCTQTKFGPFCLSPMFPLGSTAPDDGGTDSGTGGASGSSSSGTGGASGSSSSGTGGATSSGTSSGTGGATSSGTSSGTGGTPGAGGSATTTSSSGGLGGSDAGP
jgi:hypothetical protein